MAYKYAGVPNLGTLSDRWGDSRDSVRLALQRIDTALFQLYSGQNTLGDGTTVTQVGGIGGGGDGTVSFPTVKEDQAVGAGTEGFLTFGRSATNAAKALRTDANGEILIGELPGVTLSAAFDQVMAQPSFITMIGSVLHVTRSSVGNNPGLMTRVNAEWFADFNIGWASGEDQDDGDVGVLTMDGPKVNPRNFAEYQGNYYDGALGTAVGMSNGTHGASNVYLASYRFRRGVLTFTTGTTGTPPGNLTVKLFGAPTAGGAAIVMKEWEFNEANFNSSQALRFDVELPFLSVSVFAGGSPDVSNHYTLANFYVTLMS